MKIIMKQIKIIAITGVILGMVGCNFPGRRKTKDTGGMADKRLLQIVDCLEQKDGDALKNLFSVNALEEATDIDTGIDYLMQFYRGTMINDHEINQSEVGERTSGHRGRDGETEEIKARYIVTTEIDSYFIFFVDKTVDTYNPDEVGLYMIQIFKANDSLEGLFDWAHEIRYAGIYVPDGVETPSSS